ncbi:MAG: DUF1232 domain-containing protein [bacterium]|nr:DUF1232 domain-containing protein [Acidimicrobiia bacterium]MCY4649425.1 DUF1232 domain-containing protein [bacterium]
MDRLIKTVAGLAAAAPQLGKLVVRLSRDPRVPVRAKRLAAGLAVYAVLPIDLIPDLIPVVGVVDDLLALVVAVAILVESAPKDVVVEHWDGQPETLAKILLGVGLLMDFMPGRARWVIRRLVGE